MFLSKTILRPDSLCQSSPPCDRAPRSRPKPFLAGTTAAASSLLAPALAAVHAALPPPRLCHPFADAVPHAYTACLKPSPHIELPNTVRPRCRAHHTVHASQTIEHGTTDRPTGRPTYLPCVPDKRPRTPSCHKRRHRLAREPAQPELTRQRLEQHHHVCRGSPSPQTMGPSIKEHPRARIWISSQSCHVDAVESTLFSCRFPP